MSRVGGPAKKSGSDRLFPSLQSMGPVDEHGNNRSDLDLLEGFDHRLNRSSLIITLFGIPLVFWLQSAKAALSFGAGAGLSYINFHWLKQAVDFAVLQGGQGQRNAERRVLARFVGRYALIALFLYVTIRGSALQVGFVFVGLLVYVAAILIECISEVGRVLIKDYREWKNS